MTDIEKIRAEVERRRNIVNNSALQMKDVNLYYHYSEMVEEYDDILRFINSLPEEPVSEDLEEAASRYAKEEYSRKNPATLPDRCICCYAPIRYAFRNGANWQKEQMMKEAMDAKITLYDGISYVSKEKLLQYKPGDKVKIIVIKED